jgi:rhamnosyltransferase
MTAQMMTEPSVSVVIPALNGGRLFADLLAALNDQKQPACEVVVVDSGSSDDSVAVARAHGAHVVEIPQRDFNHGATRNLGIEKTTSELIVLLTQDATPASTDFLSAITAPFADPNIAGVYGRQLPRPDCDVVTARNLSHWLTGRDEPARARLEGTSLDRLPPMERYQLCVFDSVCCALRRVCWKEQPYENAAFGEDIIWGRGALQRGWSIAYEPEAAVLHSHRRSIIYEYRRTRESHALLNRLFGLATLPGARDIPRAWISNLKQDLPYVRANTPRGMEMVRQLARATGLGIVGPVAQHLGIRDAQRSRLAKREAESKSR